MEREDELVNGSVVITLASSCSSSSSTPPLAEGIVTETGRDVRFRYPDDPVLGTDRLGPPWPAVTAAASTASSEHNGACMKFNYPLCVDP